MDEERLKRIRANIAKHEERKKTQNIMGDIDSSKLDRSNTSYNKNDAAFEMAKQHYQNSYVPKKAQEYYKGVENYRNSYEQMANKPSANNYTVMTPENESANLIGDGINTYVSPQMREKAQKHYNEVFNNENKKYAEQYARLNEKSKPAYSYAQAKSEAAKKVDNSINAFSSQFKDENEYNAYADNMARAKEQQRLLNYNVAEARNKLLTMKALNMNPSVKVEDTDEYKRIESDMKKAESVQEFAKNMQNEDFRKQYAEYEQHQKDYENKNWFGKAVEQVGDAIAGSIYNTGEGMYTAFIEPVTNAADYFIGRNPYEEGTLSNKIHSFYNYVHDEADRRERFSGYAQQGLTTDLYNATNNEEFSKFTSGVITTTLDAVAEAGLSMAVAALSGGTSLAAKGIQTTVGLTKAQKVAQTASSMLKGLMKDLNFWTSFAREGGSAYNDAIDAGASNEEATIAMLATGLPNAYIEVGGGVEKFKDLAGTGVKGWLRDFAKSTGEEATEELKQGIISELVKKLTYAPETELFSTADDGSGIINPIRMYQEAFGGAVGGAFGGSVGKAINVASYTVANNMYKSDSMRELIQSGKYTEMLKALPDSDFKNSEISKTFSAEMDEKQTLAKLKGISNRQLIKQYDSMVDTLSSVSEGNVASLALIATGDTKTATEVAPILRKLYDGKVITEEEAKIISRNENVVNMLSETTGLDMTNSSWEDFVTLSEQAQFENITGTSTGNAIADVVLGNAQRAEAGRNYIAEEQNKYANDLSGTPTFTAQIGDESVKITGIEHIENGEVYVNLSNGTTQEAQSLNTDEVTTALLSYASEYDAKTASAFIGGYTGNISVGEYARSFAGVNSAARTGLSYENIAKTAQTMVNNIGESTAKYLAETGNVVAQEQKVKYDEELKNLQSRQAKRLDKASVKNETNGTATKAHKRLARTISKITGYTVTLVDSTNGYNNKQNGRTAIGSINSTKGEIVLDIGEGNVAATSLHESVHYIRINAPEEFNAMAKYVVEWLTRNGTLEEYLDRYASSYKLDNIYDLTEEMTADVAEALLKNADFVEDLFTDESFVKEICGENRTFAEKFIDALKSIIEAIKNYLKSGDVNHLIAGKLSEDAKALEKFMNLWEDGLKAAVDNHAKISNAKENTDTQSNGGVKYSKAEKNALTKEEYKRATAAFMNGDTSAIIEDCAIRVTNKNDVYKIKIVCYNLSDDEFDFQITEVYQIENYDYNIHSENEDPAVIIAKGVRDGYTQREIEALLQNNKFDDGQIFKRFSPQSGRYYRLKKSTGRGERVSGGKSSGSGLSEETEQSETESKLKFSISENDSNGNKLTKQQREYFKDSKVVDENGNLLVVYHQTNNDFTVFDTNHDGAGSYDYETPYGVFLKPTDANIGINGAKQMKLYANIVNPLIVSDRAAMSHYLKKSAKYAEGVEKIDEANKEFKARSDKAISDFKNYLINWRKNNPSANSRDIYDDAKFNELFEAEDKVSSEWTNAINALSQDAKKIINSILTSDGYDGVIINNDVGSFGRSVKSIIALENAQVKNVDNTAPTENEDIRFSLSEPVEEKGNLIAVHNIYTDKLVKSLKLGGFPMPSIAVTKADMGHENYGECSFVFDKSTIDPKSDKRNKVYGGDAWTPTYPAIEYKVSEKIADKARRKYYDLYKQYGEKVRDMYRYSVTLEDTLNSDGGEQKMLDKLYDDVSMMQIYRLDHGEDVISNVVKREEKQTLNEQEIALSKQLLSTFGNRIEEIAARNGENPLPIRKAFFNKYHDEVTEAFKKYYRSTGMSIEEAEAKVANTKTFTFVSSLAKALKYKHNKGITVTEDIDYEATDKAIRDSVDQSAYRKWIDGLFKGAEEKSGIWNGKDFYTPSGRTRNFDALHYEETLENVVKVMRSEMNGDTLFGGMGIWGVAQKEYSSIDKLKSDSARLQKMSDDEYSNIKSGFAEQLSEVTKAIKNDYSGNDFIDSDIVAGNIVDAVRKSKTKSGIKSYLKEYYPDITDTAVDDIVNLVHGIMEMPTGYFEAKPQRAIRFDEVKYAVVPETLDENIKKQLSEYGVQVVEYENGNEEDRTAKLNSLDDVKFSVSEQTSAEYEMLKQENNDLKAQIEALKKEMELTSGHTVDAEAVSKLAKRYIREYKSKANVEEVSAKLKQIFEYIANEDANAEEANKAMFELASQIVNKSETLNTEMRDTFKDELDIIRSARIYVDDATKAEIESLYGDYNTFRKSMFGRMKLTTNKESHGQTVDMLVQELAELAPGQFDTNVSEGECLEQLVSFIEATKPRIENPFGDSVAEAASELAWQIFDDYFDTPEVKTFADKYEAKLQKVINENRIARAELRKAERAKAKAFYDEKLKALRDEKNEAIAKLRKEKNDKYDNDIKNLRDAKDKKLNDVRADRDEKLKALRERYREQQREKRENAAKSELRARITAEYKKLYKDLTSNSKEHHIPEVYKETVANVLANIDLISKISKNKEARKGEMSKAAQKISDQLTKLNEFILQHSMYASKENGINTEELYNFDPDLSSNIEVLKKCFEYYANHIQNGTNAVRDMSHKEMEALYKVLKALRYAVKTADKAFSANIKQRITELAENSIAEMATDKTRNPFNKNKGAEAVGALDTYLNSQMLDARSYHRGLGDSAMEIYKAFRAGLNTYISHIHEIQDYFAKVRKESGLSEKQFKMLSEKYETYETSHGKITMSKAQLMSLYCLSKREQALEHIFGGGIRPTDLKGVRQARPIRISPDELTSLLKNLNSTELATADKLQKFIATACAKWGNEVSMAMYGYAKFGEPHYFPIKSSQTGVKTNDQNSGGETGLYSMLNYGFTKSLVQNANNAIDIDDIFNVVSQHAQEMSSYSAYAGAVADGMRWLNYNNRKTGETIKQSMLQKFGTNCEKYFTELIRDINRNKPTGNYGGELSSLLVSAQKAAAIAGNLSVVIQQPTAIMRACSVLDIDLIVKGIAIAATHSVKSAKEAQAHSEIAWWKSQGFFETNMGKSMDEIITGRSTAKDKVVGLAMKPAGFVDDLTWGAIWEATKLWTKKFHPEAEVGSDEFFSITKEKFDDVVDQTQVVDSVLHRPMILRSKNALVKMDMSFMAEPLKSANLLRNAIIDAKNKKPGATKRLIRVYASCVMANVLAAAAKAIVMAFRDTGDDEWREKWLESFVGDLLSSLNPVSIIPFVKDILTLLDGYDVERMDMSAISGIIKFGQQMVTSAQKGELDTSLSLQNVYKLTRYLSQLTGIPVYNVLREVDTIVDIFGEPIFRASQATPDTERYEALYNAVMKNDEAETQNEYDRLGKTQKEIEQRLKSKIIDDSKGNKMFNADVDKAAKARISGDVKTAVEIVRNLADTTALSKDFWTACVNARVNKISKAQENRTQLIEAGISKLTVDNMSDTEVNEALKSYEAEADTSTASDLNEDTNTESLYTANDLVKALQDGNESDYNTAYDDMLSAKAVSLIMQAEADNKELTADEAEEKAESSIKSAITKVLKPLMRKLYKTDKKKFNEMRKKIIKKFGYTSKQIAKWLTSEE
jgi:hypothetical protein